MIRIISQSYKNGKKWWFRVKPAAKWNKKRQRRCDAA
jgi:hypothetical protein